jgi:co-chaperonin GroES (HSP10)
LYRDTAKERLHEAHTIAGLGPDPKRRAARKKQRRHHHPGFGTRRSGRGEVLAVGGGRFVEDKGSTEKVKTKTFVKTTLIPGEHILYKKYAAREVDGDDKELVLVREEDVLGSLRS